MKTIKITNEQEKILKSYHNKVIPLIKLCQYLNTTPKLATTWIQKFNLNIKYKEDWTEQHDKELIDCINKKMWRADIAKKFHKPWDFLKKRLISLDKLPEHLRRRDEKKELLKQNLFRCNKCNIIKNLDQKINYDTHHNNCLDCEKKHAKEVYAKIKMGLPLEKFFELKIRSMKVRARKKGLKCTIDKYFLLNLYSKQNGKCFYSQIEMGTIPNNINLISIDRKNSDLSYTPDNVVLCCAMVNYMKINYSITDFKAMIEALHKNLINF